MTANSHDLCERQPSHGIYKANLLTSVLQDFETQVATMPVVPSHRLRFIDGTGFPVGHRVGQVFCSIQRHPIITPPGITFRVILQPTMSLQVDWCLLLAQNLNVDRNCFQHWTQYIYIMFCTSQ